MEYFDANGFANSVAITPDGLGVCLVLNNTNIILLRDKVSGVVQSKKLYTPGSEGVFLDNVKYADVVSFSPDGRFLLYDALVQEKSSDGSKVDRWSIYLMDVSTGQIWHVINSGWTTMSEIRRLVTHQTTSLRMSGSIGKRVSRRSWFLINSAIATPKSQL